MIISNKMEPNTGKRLVPSCIIGLSKKASLKDFRHCVATVTMVDTSTTGSALTSRPNSLPDKKEASE